MVVLHDDGLVGIGNNSSIESNLNHGYYIERSECSDVKGLGGLADQPQSWLSKSGHGVIAIDRGLVKYVAYRSLHEGHSILYWGQLNDPWRSD